MDQVLNTYNKCVKREKYDPLNEMFDIIKENAEWMCSEGRRLYHRQIERKGHVGYTSGKTANSKAIHPSKRKKVTLERSSTALTTATISISESETELDTQSESEYEEFEISEEKSTRKWKKYRKKQNCNQISNPLQTYQPAKQ